MLFRSSRELVATGEKRDAVIVFQRGTDRRTANVRMLPEKDFFNASLIRQKLGFVMQEMTQELSDYYGLRAGVGFVISSVDKNSPAAKAEIQPYFLVQGIDGQAPPSITEAAKYLFGKKTGETVRLNLIVPWRRGNLTGYREAEAKLTVR